MNWISVKDRFPEDGTTSLLLWSMYAVDTQSWRASNHISDGYFENEKFYSWDFGSPKVMEDITHWCEVTPPNRYSNMSEATAKDAIAAMKEGIEINKKFLDGKGVKHE